MKIALTAGLLSVALMIMAGHQAQADPFSETLTAQSFPDEGPKAMFKSCRPPGPLSQLKLTDEQLEKIHTISEKHADKIMPMVGESMRLKHKQMDLISSAGLDKQAVLELQSKLNKLHNEIADEHLAEMLEVDGVLTVEQKKDLRRSFLQHNRGQGAPYGASHGASYGTTHGTRLCTGHNRSQRFCRPHGPSTATGLMLAIMPP